jgi:hypothetical protein
MTCGDANMEEQQKLFEQSGIAVVVVALLLMGFIAITALAIDIAHLYVVRNELHNAADAGALAGARCLYDCMAGVQSGSALNLQANQIAWTAARKNYADGSQVEVNWTSGNSADQDVQRGHWRLSDHTFHIVLGNSTTPPTLWGVTSQQIDNDLTIVNAVKVVTRRENPQAKSYFAKVLGFAGFNVTAEAVAYIGFAGTLTPFSVDIPIAICQDAILNNGAYNCGTGRMISSGQTGGWTDFNQASTPCSGGTNALDLKNLFQTMGCAVTNPGTLTLGADMATTGGEVTPAWQDLLSCWRSETNNGLTQWQKTFPVVDCSATGNGFLVNTCAPLVGAVTINILRLIDTENEPTFPNQAANWTCQAGAGPDCVDCSTGEHRWDCFVDNFHLKDSNGQLLLTANNGYQKKAIYMLPDCTPHNTEGSTGGQNFGILAKTPALVE